MKTNAKIIIAFSSLAIISLAGCGSGSSPTEGLKVYTSFYPIYDLTSRILKGHGTVIDMTPAGSEPHDYEPTTSDIVGLESANVLFVNGLGMETWLSSVPSELQNRITTVSSGVATRQIGGTVDPHIWLNPENAIIEMSNIKNKLSELDPTNKDDYENNYLDAATVFEALDASFAATSASFSQKNIVVSHAAFGYLCDHYGLSQIYVDGLSTSDEPSAADIARIIEAVKTYKITTIFYEEMVSPAISEKIAEETGAKTEMLNPLEGLTEAEQKHDDYVSVMAADFRKLKEACQ